MKFKNLTEKDYEFIREQYSEFSSKEDAQTYLADHYDVLPRTIRGWANKLELNIMDKNVVNTAKVMIYDIETSRVKAKVFWTGKQYIGHTQLMDEPKIISISWKFIGDNEVKSLTWDKFKNDKAMLAEFLKEYNKADMVIGINNDNFDNRWINARSAKYGLEVNTMVRSFDVQKEMKRLFRIPSYSMKYAAWYFNLTEQKLEHEGIIMWDMIEEGTKEQQQEYLIKMVEYNVQDILTTEALYVYLRKYLGHKMHFGVFNGKEKYTCPACGGEHISLLQTQVTPAGTIQRVMRCKDDGTQFRLTNKLYLQFIENRDERINI
jgi:DNA polymerase elongation subunit (family B)